MKKCDFCISALFIVAVTMIVIIPLGLFIFSELLGYESLNELLKDHGSLIGAFFAIIGVFIMIRNQDKNTRATIEASFKLILKEQHERSRKDALDGIFKIKTSSSMISFSMGITGKSEDYQYYQNNLNDMRSSLSQVWSFIEIHGSDYDRLCINFINCYIRYNSIVIQNFLKLEAGLTIDYEDRVEENINNLRIICLIELSKIHKNLVGSADDTAERREIRRNRMNMLNKKISFEEGFDCISPLWPHWMAISNDYLEILLRNISALKF